MRKNTFKFYQLRVVRVVVLALAFTLLFATLAVVLYAATFKSTAVVMVNNKPVEIESTTTYASLRNQGYLNAGPGNMLAIDGSIFEAGGGEPPQVYSFEQPVHNLNTVVKTGDLISDETGADIVEQTVEASETIIRELLARGYRFVTIDELVAMTAL